MNRFLTESDLSGAAQVGLDAAARSTLLVEADGLRPIAAVLDIAVYERLVPANTRFAGVVRAPSGYILVGRYSTDLEASYQNENFYNRMRDLVEARDE